MRIRFAYNPFPIHVGYHSTRVREKAAIGAVGSGKTIALCGDAITLGLEQPGSRIMVARQTIPALRDTTEAEFVNLLTMRDDDDDEVGKTLYDLCEVKKTDGHIGQITMPNGTEYLFRSLNDWRKHMSLNLAAIYIDEATEITVDAYNGLKTRLRQFQPTPMARKLGYKWTKAQVRQHIALALNPNGHDWIWEYFVHAPTENRRYFQSTSFDNPTLYMDDGSPSPYLLSLLEMPEMWVRRYVMCEFDAFEGQILDYTPDRQMTQYFTPPREWERVMGLDWGLRNPTACVWWARRPGTNRWYQYREWQSYDPLDQMQRESYITMDVHTVAATIKRLEMGERITRRIADPIIQNRSADAGKSVQYWMANAGLYFELGSKDYNSRINALNTLLTGGELVLMENCQMTSMGFQQYRWADLQVSKDIDAPERPHKKNDHLVDASQYLATAFYGNKKLPTPAAPNNWTDKQRLDAEIMKQVGKQMRAAHQRRQTGGFFAYG